MYGPIGLVKLVQIWVMRFQVVFELRDIFLRSGGSGVFSFRKVGIIGPKDAHLWIFVESDIESREKTGIFRHKASALC
ncbi:hypothetical protein N7508_000752 [Penicillium antarcticum]|uniref:uncharacterized protein n=1 Tax=Penicillium antarcticum TaxID=416450 RepID=UPI00238F43D2|nr:uncharacterized protein N7508_000752 [Penicillium antarcticum]KAJ5320469.1 hypothetical protein N7508_000752 [Penicillium antarcticum]